MTESNKNLKRSFKLLKKRVEILEEENLRKDRILRRITKQLQELLEDKKERDEIMDEEENQSDIDFSDDDDDDDEEI